MKFTSIITLPRIMAQRNGGMSNIQPARDLSFGVNQLEKLADTAKVLVKAASNSMELDTVSMMWIMAFCL